jgi:uncharacterized protein (UPF0332 family)
MSREKAVALWERAKLSFSAAATLVDLDADSTASRAYYSAFYAVSAWFALRGRFYKKHSAVRAAVNQDMVHAGIWPESNSKTFAFLSNLRSTADYGLETHASNEEAEKAVKAARVILEEVSKLEPGIFTL